jgi:hypothetical protein
VEGEAKVKLGRKVEVGRWAYAAVPMGSAWLEGLSVTWLMDDSGRAGKNSRVFVKRD